MKAAPRVPALRLSVIVPFAPRESEGGVLLDQLRVLPADCEIITVHADSPALPLPNPRASRHPALREIHSLPGRARQMNAGAQAARGRWLWFLHADSHLGPRTLAALDTFTRNGSEALGFFDLHYLNDGPPFTRLNAIGANLRARWLGVPFGDQGFVLPAGWFERLGRYDESVACGEDHLLAWQAHAAGLPVRRVGAPLLTSARKYAEHGWWRTTRRHLWLTLCQAWPQWRALHKTRRTETTDEASGRSDALAR